MQHRPSPPHHQAVFHQDSSLCMTLSGLDHKEEEFYGLLPIVKSSGEGGKVVVNANVVSQKAC